MLTSRKCFSVLLGSSLLLLSCGKEAADPFSRFAEESVSSHSESSFERALPFLVVRSPWVLEDTGTDVDLVFQVEFTSVSLQEVSLSYSTTTEGISAGAATPGDDYVPVTNGRLTIPAGKKLAEIAIKIKGDSVPEKLEVFRLKLSDLVGAKFPAPSSAIAVGTIKDDDALPAELLATDVSQKRGFSGTRIFRFPISLTKRLSYPVSVRAQTRDLTALAGSDYLHDSQVITIPAGELSRYFEITVYGVAVPQKDEILFVEFSDNTLPFQEGKKRVAGILKYGE